MVPPGTPAPFPGIVRKRFPKTLTPRQVAQLIRQGVLENARFAAAVLVRGTKGDQPVLVRWDAKFPTLYQIRQRGLVSSPIAYATAHLAAIFIKHFPRDSAGVVDPAALPVETRRAILAEVRSRDFRVTLKVTRLKKNEDEDELDEASPPRGICYKLRLEGAGRWPQHRRRIRRQSRRSRRMPPPRAGRTANLLPPIARVARLGSKGGAASSSVRAAAITCPVRIFTEPDFLRGSNSQQQFRSIFSRRRERGTENHRAGCEWRDVLDIEGRIVLGEESNSFRERVKGLLAAGKKKIVLNLAERHLH